MWHVCAVKLWSTNQRLSAGTIEVQANVCTARFHPESPNHLAFGAAGTSDLPRTIKHDDPFALS